MKTILKALLACFLVFMLLAGVKITVCYILDRQEVDPYWYSSLKWPLEDENFMKTELGRQYAALLDESMNNDGKIIVKERAKLWAVQDEYRDKRNKESMREALRTLKTQKD